MMTAKLLRRALTGTLISGAFLFSVNAQDLTMDFIYGGIDDAEVILQEYLLPYANILGSDLNAGWYNTARPHKLGGLDVTATLSWAKAPLSTLSFDLSRLNLYGNLEPESSSISPSIAGSQDERPELFYTQSVDIMGNPEQVEIARFTMPNGTGLESLPLPMAQLSVGLPLGTDVSARFVPTIGYRDYGTIGLWGIGGKHSLSQWIPVIKKLKFLDIAVQGGYTKVSSSVNVQVEPLDVEVDNHPDYNWNDQFVVMDVEGWTVNLIASQTIPLISFYQGIGYASSMVNLLMEGHYPIHSLILDEESEDFGKTSYEILENPLELDYRNINKLRYNLGVRLKLGVLTLHYDFTYTLYATQSVGVGISFR